MLLDHKATIDVREDDGYTPLRLACAFVNLDAVKLLVERGADINAKDESGKTPLTLAINSASTRDKTAVLAYLREHGAKS